MNNNDLYFDMADKEMIEEKIGEAIGLEKAAQNAVDELDLERIIDYLTMLLTLRTLSLIELGHMITSLTPMANKQLLEKSSFIGGGELFFQQSEGNEKRTRGCSTSSRLINLGWTNYMQICLN